jgi:hypothetical protein
VVRTRAPCEARRYVTLSLHDHSLTLLSTVGLSAYSQEITAAYRELRESVADEDDETREAAFRPMREYCASLEHEGVRGSEGIKSVAARMYAAKHQLAGLVSRMTLLIVRSF